MINTLTELIDYLYPKPPCGLLVLGSNNPPIPPECTPEFRKAIEHARKINYDLKPNMRGLYEFHLGIIYAHWGNFDLAKKKFEKARAGWDSWRVSGSRKQTSSTKKRIPESNINDSIYLTHFAEGYMQEAKGYALETKKTILEAEEKCAEADAMQKEIFTCYRISLSLYRKVEQYLPITDDVFPLTKQYNFIYKLSIILGERTAHVHKQLFTLPPPSSQSHSDSQTSQTNSRAKTTPENDNNTPHHPPPQINMGKRPFSPPSPIPDHTNNGSYKWYSVHNIENDAFLDIKAGSSYLLIGTTHAPPYKEDDLLLISDSQDVGNITLKQCSPPHPFERIYLTRSEPIGAFERRPFNGIIKLTSSIETNADTLISPNIIGIVIGVWQVQKHITL